MQTAFQAPSPVTVPHTSAWSATASRAPLCPQTTGLRRHSRIVPLHYGARVRPTVQRPTTPTASPTTSVPAPTVPVSPTPAASVRTTPSASVGQSPQSPRKVIRVAIPSKGDILRDTKDLLSNVGIDVEIKNPRQYVATLKGMDVEVWLQRPADIVRKVRDGDVDLGITGYDLVAEYGGDTDNIVAVHDRLGYGDCHVGVGIPMSWEDVPDMDALRRRAERKTLRIATKFHVLTAKFMAAHKISNYHIVNMDGALEASTQMGTADIIVDIVQSGVTMRENLLKEIHGGTLVDSSMQLIGNRMHLKQDDEFGERLRYLAKEMLERIEAYLLGRDNFNIIANIRGSSMVDVSRRLASKSNLRGVDGPTVSPVVPSDDSDEGMYAISIVVPKSELYSAIEQLRSVGGSGVTVLPVTFIFPQKCKRWDLLLQNLGLAAAEVH